MPRKLIIRLRNTDSATPQVQWTYLNNDGRPQFPKEEEFNRFLLQSDQIVVLVPGEDVLITQVKLPKLSQSQLAKALPFALEDQLAEDPTVLHFAAGTAEKGGSLPVAVVSKDKMATWVTFLNNQLKTAFSKVTAFIPDTLAVPFKDNSYQILVNHKLALVRTDLNSGFAIEKENLFSILDLMLKRPDQKKPAMLNVKAHETVFSNEQQQQLAIPIETQSAPDNPLSLLAESINDVYAINLLQGAYATKQKTFSIEQLAKAACAVAAGLFILVLIEDVVSYLILKRVNYKITNEMQLIYSAVYPNTKIPDDPKAAMQKDLSQLRAIHADSIFIRLVNLAEPVVRGLIPKGLILKEASFRNNQLVISIETKDAGMVENLQQSLDAQGLKSAVKSAQRETSGLIETHLTIEEIS